MNFPYVNADREFFIVFHKTEVVRALLESDHFPHNLH